MIYGNVPLYGEWSLATVYTIVFALLAFFFYRPKSAGDWLSFGVFSAFLAALFVEMYGFPLTLSLLAGWGGPRLLRDSLPHEAVHVLEMMFDWRANPPFGVFQVSSTVLIIGGFVLLAMAWSALHRARQARELARAGVYARVRHPEYVAFILIMVGFLLQWPTLITLAIFPIAVVYYLRSARREEQEALHRFGDSYRLYQSQTPAFVPRIALARQA